VPLASPVGGRDYPRNLVEMTLWFSTQEDCLDYLEWLRWPDGIRCRRCDGSEGWHTGRGDWLCAGCGTRTSITAGTVFDKTRVPLPGWFLLAWRMTAEKTAGISVKGAQRLLELGSYQTAWTMLHKLRSAMVRPGRDRLNGDVEVDETFVGGARPGAPGRGAAGKTLVCVAVEVLSPKGFGRVRLGLIPDASAKSLHAFVADYVEPGSIILTDGWRGYRGLDTKGTRTMPRASVPAACTPTCRCRPFTGSPRSSSGRCSTPTSRTHTCTCRPTAMSGRSGSTGAVQRTEGSCSFGCSRTLSSAARSSTPPSRLGPNPARPHQ
jgi:transposase-like protein